MLESMNIMNHDVRGAQSYEHHEQVCAQMIQDYEHHEQVCAQMAQRHEHHEHQNGAQVYKVETRHP